LQERTFERIGGSKPIPLDVRVIAATNRDLDRAIAGGSFRADLYYRLSVFPIHVPALRDRAEDIPLLVEYLAGRYAARSGRKAPGLSSRSIELLTAYDWPGNIRELQNVVERAVILSEDQLVVDESWLPKQYVRPPASKGALGRPSAREETEVIEAALAGSRGRVSGPDGAAAKLGIPRSTLESKIRSLNIDKNRFKTD
jgi:formate hydrogenlyase transcriptional activator